MKGQPRTPLSVIESQRLTLVAASSELVEADLQGAEAFGGKIDAHVPENWPPPLFESTAMRAVMEQLRDPSEQGWSIWYLMSKNTQPVRVIGICGFKGRPDAAGSVEISYSVLSQYRVQGYATEAVARLVSWAFSHQNVIEVTAETLPHLRQSIRVMEKNGLKFTGPGSEQGVVRYVVSKTPGH
jgi:RimJ/RimL family protein N-acetyltransferase